MAVIPIIIAGQAAAGILGAVTSASQARAAAKEKDRLAQDLLDLENSRQEIINPYANVSDLSSMLSNPMANLGVATQAAEMQAEQADIALASTLDTLRATGASAGGATALAQAALQSKKGVSASIEQQEVQNEKLRAQGEQMLQSQKMAEAQRLQRAETAGEQFMFGVREAREIADLDRTSDLLSQAEARQMQAMSDMYGAIGGAITGIAGTASSAAAAGLFSNNNSPGGIDVGEIVGGNNTSSLMEGLGPYETNIRNLFQPRLNSILNNPYPRTFEIIEGGDNFSQYRPSTGVTTYTTKGNKK
tara:strand:+ start:331 stop:1242 length:912 start_codon:yes stop_codon:yes gene_type:complete